MRKHMNMGSSIHLDVSRGNFILDRFQGVVLLRELGGVNI
jgi:hypothetical protein